MLELKVSFKSKDFLGKKATIKSEDWGTCRPRRPQSIRYSLLRKDGHSRSATPRQWPAALFQRCPGPCALDPLRRRYGLYPCRNQNLSRRLARQRSGWSPLEKISAQQDPRGRCDHRTLAPPEIPSRTPAQVPLPIPASLRAASEPQPGNEEVRSRQLETGEKRSSERLCYRLVEG